MIGSFEVRSFTLAGVQDKVLSGAAIEFTDELGAEGYVKVSMARSKAIEQGLAHRTEVGVFLDGAELEGSRGYLVETTGNPSSGEDAAGESADAVWGGRTLHAGTKGINTYPTVFPVLTGAPKNYIFTDKTAGFILKKLLDDARTRGAASDIQYSTWNALTDSNGVGWAKTLKLEIKPGTDLKSIIENMIKLGAIEFRWVGRELKIFNADTFGMDWTTGDNPICLFRGREIGDSPYSESSDDVVNALLIMGDDGVMIEKVDTDSIALYGRREGTLSQGGTTDLGMLNFLGETTLSTSAKMRGEYTIKINTAATSARPFVNYRVGDWVLYDRVAGQPPEKFRVRQISITSDGDTQSVVVTLNDKFAELDLRTAKKVEGIVAGSMDGSTPVTTAPEEVDTLDPSPPTAVAAASESYVDGGGTTRALAITSWVAPTTNVDGSPLTDLAGFDIEHRMTDSVDYTANTAWFPATTDARLQARFDRRGQDKVNAWVGGDGGASVRAANGDDWFFWSDTNWGRMAADGHLIEWNSMPRSSITKSDPTTLNELRSYAGRRNLLTDGPAYGTGGWVVPAAASLEYVAGGWGANGRSVRVTALSTSNVYAATPSVPVVAGRQYFLQAQFDPSSTAGSLSLRYQWNSAGTAAVVPADGLITAPPDATTVRLLPFSSPAVVGTWFGISYAGVYETDHALQTWAPQTSHETFYNEVTNPDGVSGTAATGSDVLAFTNLSPNPSGEVDNSAWRAYGGTTESRLTDATAWSGSSYIRITSGTGAAGLGAMHYPVLISENTGYVARARIRGTVGKTIYGTIANYKGGSGVGGGGVSSDAITLTADWQEIAFPPSVGAATANNLGLQFVRTGTWGVGDYFEVDGVEVVQGSILPPFYFDGDTATPNGYRAQWNGAAGTSTSSLYIASEVGRNWMENPRVWSDLTDWFTYGGGTTISRTKSQVYGSAGARGPIPEVVNPDALSTWLTALSQASTRTVGVGVMGDSCTESTGSLSNPDLSDRYIERLQSALRKYSAVSGVPVNPEGYYGASTYIPVGYVHDGPPDWVFETADAEKFPLAPLQTGAGVGGRFRNLNSGHRAHFTATFERVRISYGTSGYGRRVRVTIDGEQRAIIDTYADLGKGQWLSPVLPRGEHTVVCEYLGSDRLPPGSSVLFGADIWDGDYNKGVRVYDLSGSGKAAYDIATGAREMDSDFDNRPMSLLVLTLGFNDFGRASPWPGGARTRFDFKNDVKAIIAGARARGFSGSVLLVGQWDASQLTPGTTGETQANFRGKLREIANEDAKVAFTDLSTVMPDTVGDTTKMYADGLHPSTLGMERIAECLHYALLPQSNGEASVQGLLTGETSLAGVEARTSAHATPWPVGTTYSAGMVVKAPAGTPMLLRVLCTGDTGTSDAFTATGNWQFVKSTPTTVTASATTAPRAIVRTANAEKTHVWATRAIISRAPVTEYFDGSTPKSGTVAKWDGSLYKSQSALSTISPNLWSTFPQCRLSFDPTQRVEGMGSVLVTNTSPINAPGATVDVAAAAGKYVTVILFAKTDFAVDEYRTYVRNGSTTLFSVVTPANRDDAWTEIRLQGVPASAVTNVHSRAYQSASVGVQAPTGARVWFSEATLVANDNFYYRGGPFHGGQSSQAVETAWTGISHGSRSSGTFFNSSSTPNFNQAGALFHPMAAGGNLTEYVWVTGAVKSATADKAYVFCNGMRNRALREGGGWNFQRNGTIYIAEYDLTATKLTRWLQWFDDPNVQWGEASAHHGGYLYVFGSGGSVYTGQTYLMRVPSGNPIDGARTFWNGTGWSSNSAAAVSVAATAASGGFSGVRTFNGKWLAVHVGGFMNHMDGYEAPAPQGPWTRVGPVVTFAEKSNYSGKYSARFHPQLDSNEHGIAISYSESGVNGNVVYGVKFARGPKGATTPKFSTTDAWLRHATVEASPDYQALLPTGWAYEARVRSRDKNARVSNWVHAAPIVLAGDSTPPPKPAKPLATSFFRGARIEVSGLTAAGGAYPADFLRLTVHQSTSEDFTPSDSNMIDSLTTRGGIVISSGLTWGTAYFWKVVAWDRSGNASEASEAATAQSERLSDPDLPEDLIDGAKHIKDESLSVKNFSVGAFGTSLVPNGNMEEHEAGAELPVGWTKGWPYGEFTDWETAATFAVETEKPVAGSKSIKISPTARSSRQLISSMFPLTPGDIYYVKFKVRTSRKLGSNFIEMGLTMGDTKEAVNGFTSASSISAVAAVSDGSSTEDITVEGQIEVPDYYGDGSGNAMHFGSFFVNARHDGTSGYTLWFDDVEVRQVVGSAALANASINRAKIRYLAVDDARIASLGVGKLVAGELWADITVSSRIMTSKSGQRVELNRDGLFGFNAVSNEPVTEIRSDNGGMISRWIRTNTAGARIEMGTYGAGANSALMSFFPDNGVWQFPPALGFGGASRQGNHPGITVHAGSESSLMYQRYGMNLITTSQQGGFTALTGNLLDTSEADWGAPITLNAGGARGVIDIRAGSHDSSGGDRSRILLTPWIPGYAYPVGAPPRSRIDLNFGILSLMPSGTWGEYSLRFYGGQEAPNGYGNSPWNHLLITTGYGGLRMSTAVQPNAFIVSPGGVIRGSGWQAAAKIQSEGSSDYYCSFYADSQNVGIRVYDSARNLILQKVI